jgi:hypothetical protein
MVSRELPARLQFPIDLNVRLCCVSTRATVGCGSTTCKPRATITGPRAGSERRAGRPRRMRECVRTTFTVEGPKTPELEVVKRFADNHAATVTW